jgi:RNA polymerase sigma factor (sigma-70 family)
MTIDANSTPNYSVSYQQQIPRNLVLAKAAKKARSHGLQERYDAIARRLVMENMDLIGGYARKKGKNYMEDEDATQTGVLGALQSIGDLDPSKGSFETHVRDSIRSSVSDASYHSLRSPLSRYVFCRRGLISQSYLNLVQKLGRDPNEYELAEYINKKHPDLKNKIQPYQVRRFWARKSPSELDPNIVRVQQSEFSGNELAKRLKEIVHGTLLDDYEKRLILDHYGFNGESVSLTDIAKERGTTRAAVSKKHYKILKKLRKALALEFNLDEEIENDNKDESSRVA